jgi:hypothetical protein
MWYAVTRGNAVPTFRERFEPHLLSPKGAHLNADKCRKSWDEGQARWGEEFLGKQFDYCVEWLSLKGMIKNINRDVGTSYTLKHAVERYCREKGDGIWIANGVLLMAAHHLGFKIEPYESNYCGGGWDCYNAYLNISKKPIESERVRRGRRVFA